MYLYSPWEEDQLNATYNRRAAAIERYNNATTNAGKEAAAADIERLQRQISQASPQLVAKLDQTKVSTWNSEYAAYQTKLQSDRAAYQTKLQEEREEKLKREKSLAARNAAIEAEKGRLKQLKSNRDTLTNTLARARRTQRSRAKAIAAREHRANYVLSHRFYVEMDGVIRAAFSECSGFGLDVKKELYLEGGVNDQQRVMLGHAEFQDTVLKRGMTNDSSFWQWMKEILVGRGDTGGNIPLARTRRNINILMMNQAGSIMQVCTLVGAVPIGWKAPAFQADSAAVAIEEMTLAYEGIQMQFQADTPLGAGGASSLLLRDSLGFFPEN